MPALDITALGYMQIVHFIFTEGGSTLVQLSNGLVTPPKKTIFTSFVNFFAEVFLPQGYPESVRNDYSSYQIWDTVQVC